jgi:putative phosphoesterase
MKIGIFSDAHGHVNGFLTAINRMKFSGAEKMWFLGDAVGYIPSLDVLRLQRQYSDVSCLLGNHDEMLVSEFMSEDMNDYVYKHSLIRSGLNYLDKKYIQTLPRYIKTQIDGLEILFIHGSPLNYTQGYVYPDSSLEPFSRVDADVIFMGHTHRYFHRYEYGRRFINVGSCGLPRDSDPRGCAVLFDTKTGAVTELRFSLAASSQEILALLDVAKPTAAYLRRYATLKDES